MKTEEQIKNRLRTLQDDSLLKEPTTNTSWALLQVGLTIQIAILKWVLQIEDEQ